MRVRFGWLLACLGFLVGCSSSEGQFAPVSGVVYLNNKPLANATVTFTPVISDKGTFGPGSHAITDTNGRFTLQVSTTRAEGALVGKHTVRISLEEIPKGDPGGAHLTKELLPARYNRDSKMTFEVPPAGNQNAKFELTRP